MTKSTKNTSLVITGIFMSVMLVLTLIPALASAQYYCTYHAYKLCVDNNIYWYSGCHQQQDLYSVCSNGLTCQYGQCVNYVQPVYQPVQSNYNPYYRTACYNSSVHWFDSLGVESGLYKDCKDSNGCTLDSCSGNACSNTLKCDGSTCAVDSTDYNIYCQPSVSATDTPIDTDTTTNPAADSNNSDSRETTANCPNDCEADIDTDTSQGANDPAVAAVSNTTTNSISGLGELLKRWYVWVIVAIVLILLFVIVFKRLSSQV